MNKFQKDYAEALAGDDICLRERKEELIKLNNQLRIAHGLRYETLRQEIDTLTAEYNVLDLLF